MAKTNTHHMTTISERTQMLLLKADGLTDEEVGKRLKIPRRTVSGVLKRTDLRKTVENQPHLGLPSKITKKMFHEINLGLARGHLSSSASICKFLWDEYEVDMTPSGVHKAMVREGFYSYTLIRKPLVSRKVRQARLKWARQYLKNGADFWRTVVFTDETSIERVAHGKHRHVWLKKGFPFGPARMEPTAQHGGGSLRLWAAITCDGVLAWSFLMPTSPQSLMCVL